MTLLTLESTPRYQIRHLTKLLNMAPPFEQQNKWFIFLPVGIGASVVEGVLPDRRLCWPNSRRRAPTAGDDLVLSRAQTEIRATRTILSVSVYSVVTIESWLCTLPGIPPTWICYSIPLGFTFFICKMGRTGITPSILSLGKWMCEVKGLGLH